MNSLHDFAVFCHGIAQTSGAAIEERAAKNFFGAASKQISEDTANNYLESRSPDGVPWLPLKWRIGMPLILTGMMMEKSVLACRHPAITGGGGQFDMLITLDTPFYFPYHQFGTYRIPQREFFGIRPETEASFDQMLEDAIVGELVLALNAAGV